MLLPSGTVTFLFTDIEGSTRLWEDHPSEVEAALELHDQVLRSAIEDRGGYVWVPNTPSWQVRQHFGTR